MSSSEEPSSPRSVERGTPSNPIELDTQPATSPGKYNCEPSHDSQLQDEELELLAVHENLASVVGNPQPGYMEEGAQSVLDQFETTSPAKSQPLQPQGYENQLAELDHAPKMFARQVVDDPPTPAFRFSRGPARVEASSFSRQFPTLSTPRIQAASGPSPLVQSDTRLSTMVVPMQPTPGMMERCCLPIITKSANGDKDGPVPSGLLLKANQDESTPAQVIESQRQNIPSSQIQDVQRNLQYSPGEPFHGLSIKANS